MIEKLVIPEIRELIAARDFATLGEVLNRWHSVDLAGLLGRLSDEDDLPVFLSLRKPLALEVFAYLDRDSQERLLHGLPEDESARLLEGMSPDDRTALLEDLPGETVARLMETLSPGERDVARSLLRYEKESVGRLMTPDFVAVGKDWTVQLVLDNIRAHGKDSETLDVICVVDENRRLLSEIRVRELLLAPLNAQAGALIGKPLAALKATDDKKTAVTVFRKYDRTALPVVDGDDRLVGIVTIDDVLDIADEQATAEIQRFGGVEALDEPYVKTPFWDLVRKRASWLIVLFVGEMLTATAMGYFEAEIARAVVLALFVPLIISSGGNSGSQAATLIIRALALGEIRLRDWRMVLRREVASGFVLGSILGTIGFLRIAIWSQFSALYGVHWPLIGLTVALSLVGIVLWGTVSGSMLPLVLKRLGFDPATSSAPFVATLVDVTGLVIYFTVALVVLRGTLL